ncbi:carbon-nitrogen hydrolase family protein [Phenylobacterium sp.]|uniref:carbon-nitrogen hydrolase family protein n=1 Tax=Phenylobacterium sp. TaxID=1871053 RepID=UPI00272F69C7|nr:carbon-nitrogen hydrolase family protein [Phenylobacterium sp.]MDP1617603.1 carbon-nitrogen hydrolase family protein [Phenylobacterium sp.]MDP1988309.1 carbon-nitrogen hydrolase family protein [Phenylobacterium sp.]
MTPIDNQVRIAAAQTPVFWEDIDGALAYARDVIGEAHDAGAALLCFPEGFLQGYLVAPELARRAALDLGSSAFADVVGQLPEAGPMLVLGMIEAEGERLYNTAVVLEGRRLIGRYRKTHLLKSEAVFSPGDDCPVFEAGGLRFGINICFDTNFPEAAQKVAEQGASLLVCPANNMLPRAIAVEWKDRHNLVRGDRCRETGLWCLSADVTGERGDRVAWGPTALLDAQGEVVAQLPLDAPGLLVCEVPVGRQG